MSERQEFNAATVEEAIAKASKKLSTPEPELNYETLDDGSPGFLGIGARDARISVTVPDVAVNIMSAELAEAPTEDEDLEQGGDEEQEPAEPDKAEYDEQDSTSLTAEESSSSNFAASDDLLEEVKIFTVETVEAMGFDARVDVYDTDEFIAVDVSPGDTGLFIGQKGETIDALQHLLNISAYRDREFVKRIVLDSEGYRQRRIEAVQGMAHRMARRAQREGRTIELPPMNSSERRIVHTYLKENPKVGTSSDGTGGSRRVNIFPAN